MKKKLEPAERLERWKENQPWVQKSQAAFQRSTEPESAVELLHDPDLFPLLLADIGKAGLVRERRNALATYIIATSRLREKPLNEIIAHAVDYAGTNRLANKVIYIDEQVGRNHPLRQTDFGRSSDPVVDPDRKRWASCHEGACHEGSRRLYHDDDPECTGD